MFANKKIAIVDDDSLILNAFELYAKKKYPENEFHLFEKYSKEVDDILDDLDVIVIDYFNDPTTNSCKLIREISTQHPFLMIVCVSGAFKTEANIDNDCKTNLMKKCLNSGATRVSSKIIPEVFDIIDSQFKAREYLLS